MELFLILIIVFGEIDLIRGCSCTTGSPGCSNLFECVNCYMDIDSACKPTDYSISDQTACYNMITSNTARYIADYNPDAECRYSQCTESPIAISNSNRTMYWKTCDTGCSKYVATKHPDSYVQTVGGVSVSALNEKDCYRNCLPSTMDCMITWDGSVCRVYAGCGSSCLLGTQSGTMAFIIKCMEYECGAPSSPTNGNVVYAGTRSGYTATFTCNTGFTLFGSSSTTCATGGWTNPTPSCPVTDCGIPTHPTDGTVSYTTTTYNSVISYGCNTGYTLSGNSSNICGSDGNWNNAVPACVIVDCGAPSFPTDGSRTYTTTTYNSVATYNCNTGYTLSGATTAICLSTGSWDNSPPTCTIVDCGAPSSPTDGSRTYTTTTYNSVATYSCNTGYILSGATTATCLSTGSWDITPPTCTLVDCGALSSPLNGSVIYTTTFYSSSATYNCNSGHVLLGVTTVTCLSTGSWDNSPPTCSFLDCGTPSSPVNGSVAYTTTWFDSLATFSCDNGFALSGASNATCLSTGSWDVVTPNCSVVDCGPPSSITGGTVSFTSTTFGSDATYSCNEGYSMTGTGTVKCSASSNWSPSNPSCDFIDCGNLTAPNFGNVSYASTYYGSSASYTCTTTGYKLVGPSSRSCLLSGSWSGNSPQCNLIDCGALSPLIQGQVEYNGTTYGEKAVYTCNAGYNMTGSNVSTCGLSEVWSPAAPSCTGSLVTTTAAPSASRLYIMPCLCYPNKTFTGMTEEEILAYLVAQTSINTRNTSAELSKLKCANDNRQSAVTIGTLGIAMLSVLGALFLCIDLMSVCQKERSYV